MIQFFIIILAILFWGVTLWVAYIAGMTRGFKNFTTNNPDHKFDKLDASVYSQVTGKKLSDINPVAEMLADKKIQDFKDAQKIELRKKAAKIQKAKLKKAKAKKFKK